MGGLTPPIHYRQRVINSELNRPGLNEHRHAQLCPCRKWAPRSYPPSQFGLARKFDKRPG